MYSRKDIFMSIISCSHCGRWFRGTADQWTAGALPAWGQAGPDTWSVLELDCEHMK